MQTIYIDISNKGVIQPIYTKQGDIGRKFVAVFLENGQKYDIPSGSIFSAWYKGPSGEGNYTDIGEKSAFSVANNRVTVEIISEMLGIPGEGFICLVLTKGSGGQIGSWNIPYICEEVPGFGSEEAKEYYTAFSKMVDSIRSNPENITIDDTLSVPSAAADAFAVGDKILDLSLTLQEHDVSIANNTVEIDILKETVEKLEDSGGGITDEELIDKVEDIVVTDLIGGGPIRAEVHSVADSASESMLIDYDLIRPDEDAHSGYSLNVVTKEQHDKDIKDTEQYAMAAADEARYAAEDEIALQINNIYLEMYTKTEVDAALAESKAVIVTVNGTTPSHTSQEIYALIQAGKVVYLELWGNTYTLCTACTASEAKFENSYITSTTGADGKNYQAQQFRVYLIKNNVFNNGQAVAVPGTDYINAQIAHALGQ